MLDLGVSGLDLSLSIHIQIWERIRQRFQCGYELLARASALKHFLVRLLNAVDEGRVLDEALVFLCVQEVVGDGSSKGGGGCECWFAIREAWSRTVDLFPNGVALSWCERSLFPDQPRSIHRYCVRWIAHTMIAVFCDKSYDYLCSCVGG